MEVTFSDDFNRKYNKIKNEALRLRLLKVIKKLRDFPYSGKPLRHNLKEHRNIRVRPFRIIYRIEEDSIVVICFDYRKYVYD